MVILFGIIFLTASCYGDKLKRKKEIKKKHPKNSINKEMNYINMFPRIDCCIFWCSETVVYNMIAQYDVNFP
jgi:hypothetical protein